MALGERRHREAGSAVCLTDSTAGAEIPPCGKVLAEEVEGLVCDAHARIGVGLANETIDVIPVIGGVDLAHPARAASAEAASAAHVASDAMRLAVATLTDQCLLPRDVATLLHISPWRVSQLAAPRTRLSKANYGPHSGAQLDQGAGACHSVTGLFLDRLEKEEQPPVDVAVLTDGLQVLVVVLSMGLEVAGEVEERVGEPAWWVRRRGCRRSPRRA